MRVDIDKNGKVKAACGIARVGDVQKYGLFLASEMYEQKKACIKDARSD